jgi:hypothetical protein
MIDAQSLTQATEKVLRTAPAISANRCQPPSSPVKGVYDKKIGLPTLHCGSTCNFVVGLGVNCPNLLLLPFYFLIPLAHSAFANLQLHNQAYPSGTQRYQAFPPSQFSSL